MPISLARFAELAQQPQRTNRPIQAPAIRELTHESGGKKHVMGVGDEFLSGVETVCSTDDLSCRIIAEIISLLPGSNGRLCSGSFLLLFHQMKYVCF